MARISNPDASSSTARMEELEDLFEHAPCGYLSLHPDGRIERVNATFLAWTGHSHTELADSRFQDLLTIAGKIYYETHFSPMLRMQGFFDEVALDLVAKDGNPIPALVNAVERRGRDDQVNFIRVTVFNATDRRRYELELLAVRNALDRANHELRAFYDTLPVGIFRADAAGGIVQASRRFSTLLGVDAPDDWRTAIVDDDLPATEQQVQRAFRAGEPLSHRFRVAGGEAGFRYIELKAVPIPGSGTDAPAFVGVVEDVTERVRIDVQQRQIDRQSAVSQLTGGLAHTLNNILMIIVGNLETLEDALVDRPELRGTLEGGLAATQRAAVLVSRLLVFAGHSTARPDAIEIDACLRAMLEALSRRIGTRHRLIGDLRAPGAVVELDAGLFKEAIQELVANAAAAMPAGGEIRLSTRSERPHPSMGQEKVVIALSDQGIGMDEATLVRAREPFFTMREVGRGIGLGLSVVDGVSRIAGGELRLRSVPDAGTTAELHLPLVSD